MTVEMQTIKILGFVPCSPRLMQSIGYIPGLANALAFPPGTSEARVRSIIGALLQRDPSGSQNDLEGASQDAIPGSDARVAAPLRQKEHPEGDREE